jgi:hypothetical protein
MDQCVDFLLQDYESGRLSRRQGGVNLRIQLQDVSFYGGAGPLGGVYR